MAPSIAGPAREAGLSPVGTWHVVCDGEGLAGGAGSVWAAFRRRDRRGFPLTVTVCGRLSNLRPWAVGIPAEQPLVQLRVAALAAAAAAAAAGRPRPWRPRPGAPGAPGIKVLAHAAVPARVEVGGTNVDGRRGVPCTRRRRGDRGAGIVHVLRNDKMWQMTFADGIPMSVTMARATGAKHIYG